MDTTASMQVDPPLKPQQDQDDDEHDDNALPPAGGSLASPSKHRLPAPKPWFECTVPERAAVPPHAPTMRHIYECVRAEWLTLFAGMDGGAAATTTFERLHLYRIGCAVGRVRLEHWARHFCNVELLLLYRLHAKRNRWLVHVVGIVEPKRAEQLARQYAVEPQPPALDAVEQALLVRSFPLSAATAPRAYGQWFVPSPLVQMAEQARHAGSLWQVLEREPDMLPTVDRLLVRCVSELLAITDGSDGALLRATQAVETLYAANAVDLRLERGRYIDIMMRARYALWLTQSTLHEQVRQQHRRTLSLWTEALATLCYSRREQHALDALAPFARSLCLARKPLAQVHGAHNTLYSQQSALLAAGASSAAPRTRRPQDGSGGGGDDHRIDGTDVSLLERLYQQARGPATWQLGVDAPLPPESVVGYVSFLRTFSTLLHANAATTHCMLYDTSQRRYVLRARSALERGTVYWHVLLLPCPVHCHFGVLCDEAATSTEQVHQALANWLRVDFDVADMHVEPPPPPSSNDAEAPREWLVVLPRECYRSVRAMETRLRVFGAQHMPASTTHGKRVFAQLGALRLRLYLPPAHNPAHKQVILPLTAPWTLHAPNAQLADINSSSSSAAESDPAEEREAKRRAHEDNVPLPNDAAAAAADEPLAKQMERDAEARVTSTLLSPYCDMERNSNAPPTALLCVEQALVPAQYSMGGGYALITYEQVPHWLTRYCERALQRFEEHARKVGMRTAARQLLAVDDLDCLYAQLTSLRELVAPPPAVPTACSSSTTAISSDRDALEFELCKRAPAIVRLVAERYQSMDQTRKIQMSAEKVRCGSLEIGVGGQWVGSWRKWSNGAARDQRRGKPDFVGLVAFVFYDGDTLRAAEHCVRLVQELSPTEQLLDGMATLRRSDALDERKQREVDEIVQRCQQPLHACIAHYLRHTRGLGDDAPRELIELNAAFRSSASETHPISRVHGLAMWVCTMEPLADGRVCGLQRVYTTHDGSSKYRPVSERKDDKAKLSKGACGGGRLCVVQAGGEHNEWVALCEGPETALSVALADRELRVCTAFGVANLRHFDRLREWPRHRRALLCMENDDVSPREMAQLEPLLKQRGYEQVIFVRPPKGYKDFNDVHQRHAGAAGTAMVRQIIDAARYVAQLQSDGLLDEMLA